MLTSLETLEISPVMKHGASSAQLYHQCHAATVVKKPSSATCAAGMAHSAAWLACTRIAEHELAVQGPSAALAHEIAGPTMLHTFHTHREPTRSLQGTVSPPPGALQGSGSGLQSHSEARLVGQPKATMPRAAWCILEFSYRVTNTLRGAPGRPAQSSDARNGAAWCTSGFRCSLHTARRAWWASPEQRCQERACLVHFRVQVQGCSSYCEARLVGQPRRARHEHARLIGPVGGLVEAVARGRARHVRQPDRRPARPLRAPQQQGHQRARETQRA